MQEQLTEAAGWVGVLCILGAYGALSFGYLEATSVWYHGINLVGGVGIIIDAVADKNYQPAVLNIVWIAFAVFAILRLV
ncbi:MAG: hypothetical protein P8J32_00370 [bacterium]|nr:hypothetical protein [bacterium]